MSTANKVAGSATVELTADGFAPQVSIPITDLASVWVLFYRHGVNPNCSKGFVHRGDMRSAVDRAKKHCDLMGYRYVFIRPFVVDIAQEEIDRGKAIG